jgi:hypothetical protein
VGDWRDLARRYADQCGRVPEIAQPAVALADTAADQHAVDRVRELYHRSRQLAWRRELVSGWNLSGLRDSLACLASGSPQHQDYLRQLDQLTARLDRDERVLDSSEPLAELRQQWETLRRAALVADNPLRDFDQLLFVRRQTYQSSHYYTDFIDGCQYFGGNLCVLSLRDGSVRELVPGMRAGIFGRYDLSFDAQKVVFDWKAGPDEGFRIFEVGIDGSGLRQLTFPPDDEAERIRRYSQQAEMQSWAGKPLTYRHFTDDMHPCYLPDGGIAFISTRCEYGILCDGPDVFSTTVLYRMDADGGHIEKLSNSSVSEASPSVTNDGRILYTRWEYLDKGAVSVKCLWAMNPDGSGSAEVYGNDIADPCTLLFGRAIAGTSNLFVCLGTPHCCPIPGVGTVLTIDTNRDIRTEQPLTYVTPHIRIDLSGHNVLLHERDGRWVKDRCGPIYKDPYPLADPDTGFGGGKYFLVAYNPDREWNDPTAYGLYLLDAFGNTVPIHTEADTSCWQPMPLRPRPTPPVIAPERQSELAEQGLARLIVTDIYRGMRGVQRGTVKYLRINEQVPRPWAARRRWDGDVVDQQHAAISLNCNLGLKVQHGVVPVEADDSAHFLVPADKNIFLQVLDEDYLEIQRERTYVNYRPGETRSCVGCHERPAEVATGPPHTPLALLRAASLPGPQPGELTGFRPLHYPTDVQPILDQHCVRCHGPERTDAELDLSGTPTQVFSVSYENILRRDLLPIIGENHPKWQNVHYLPPYSLGSHRSKLIQLLREGHEDVQLSPEELVRLTTWVDSNGQYFGSYWGRRNLRYADHPNFRPVPTAQQAVSYVAPLPEEQR